MSALSNAWNSWDTSRRRLVVILGLVGALLVAGIIMRAVNGPSSSDIPSMSCSELRSYYRDHIENVDPDASFSAKQKAATDASVLNARADRLGCGDF